MSSRAIEEPITLAAVAAKRRAALARDYFVEDYVQRRLGIDPEMLVQWRKASKILAVWHGPEQRYLYPPFQFAGNRLLDEIATLLSLRGAVGADRSGWSAVEWLLAPHVLLDGQRPADVLRSNPDSVVAAAEVEFMEAIQAIEPR